MYLNILTYTNIIIGIFQNNVVGHAILNKEISHADIHVCFSHFEFKIRLITLGFFPKLKVMYLKSQSGVGDTEKLSVAFSLN